LSSPRVVQSATCPVRELAYPRDVHAVTVISARSRRFIYVVASILSSQYANRRRWVSIMGVDLDGFLVHAEANQQGLVAGRGVATFSALGGREMMWGAYDSK